VDRLQEAVVEVKDREFLVLPSRPRGMGLAYTPPSMARRGHIALISLVTAAACGDAGGGKPDGAVTPGDAWVELGTGAVDFEELPDEGDIVLVSGPQGGHHFVVSARMHGLQPGDPGMPGTQQNPATRFSVWNEVGVQLDVQPPPYRLGYEQVSDGVYALPGGHIIQVEEEFVPALVGARVKIRVELEDATGARVTDERWVVAVSDAGPEADAGPPAAAAEIGTAIEPTFDGFEPIAAESDLVLHEGSQGGHHFFLHARIEGLAPDNPTTGFSVWNEGGDRVDISGPFQLSYEDAGGGLYQLPNGIAVQVDESQVTAIIGARVRVAVEVTDLEGIQVTDERWVHAVAE
jgi:hypothetical protein